MICSYYHCNLLKGWENHSFYSILPTSTNTEYSHTHTGTLTWLHSAAKRRIPAPSDFLLPLRGHLHLCSLTVKLCMDMFQVGQAEACDMAPGWNSQIWWVTKGHVESCWHCMYLLISRLGVLFNEYLLKWYCKTCLCLDSLAEMFTWFNKIVLLHK